MHPFRLCGDELLGYGQSDPRWSERSRRALQTGSQRESRRQASRDGLLRAFPALHRVPRRQPQGRSRRTAFLHKMPFGSLERAELRSGHSHDQSRRLSPRARLLPALPELRPMSRQRPHGRNGRTAFLHKMPRGSLERTELRSEHSHDQSRRASPRAKLLPASSELHAMPRQRPQGRNGQAAFML